jgi:hypothetical protein
MSSNSFAPHKPIHMHTGLGNLIYQMYFSILIHTHNRVLLIKDNTWFEHIVVHVIQIISSLLF